MTLFKYSNMFGEPNTGLHKYRFLDLAIIDVLLTFLLGLFVSKLFKKAIWKVLIILFLLAIFFHRIFCVNTTINKLLFGKLN
jgi:hypothetical protein